MTASTAAHSKSELRQKIRAALGNISPAVRAVESSALCERLQAQISSARSILFFAPLQDEPDIWPVVETSLALGVHCALPFFDAPRGIYGAKRLTTLATDLSIGKFGIREPATGCAEIPLDQLDLVLAPGVAFDSSGRRLGRGRGFYDRLLAAASGVKCGVAYDFQLLETIPAEPHDARVNFILTPARCVCRKRD